MTAPVDLSAAEPWLPMPPDTPADSLGAHGARVAAAAYVRRVRPDLFRAGAVPTDPSVIYGAQLLAARLWARRGSPTGLASYGEFGPAAVLRFDPDVERLLGVGAAAAPPAPGWADVSTIARAEQLAAQLLGAGIPATHDANKVAALAPAVLVGPPRLAFDAYDHPTATWRLLAVASSPDPLTGWQQVDALTLQVADLLPVEAAEPVSFAASPSDDPLPAYALTFTD